MNEIEIIEEFKRILLDGHIYSPDNATKMLSLIALNNEESIWGAFVDYCRVNGLKWEAETISADEESISIGSADGMSSKIKCRRGDPLGFCNLIIEYEDQLSKANLLRWSDFIGKTKSTYDIHSTNPIIKGLLDKITPMGETFIEWGFGTGYTAIALANRKKKVIAYDPAPGLCDQAYRVMLNELVSPYGKVEFINDVRMFKDVMADVVYSQGLLEHFSDQDIVAMIRQQLQYAKVAVVFSVPSGNYKSIDFGDERLMDISQWETILTPFSDRLTQLYHYERRQQLMGVIRR